MQDLKQRDNKVLILHDVVRWRGLFQPLEKLDKFKPRLRYNVSYMKSWLTPNFQNAINADSQFFIYGVMCRFLFRI